MSLYVNALQIKKNVHLLNNYEKNHRSTNLLSIMDHYQGSFFHKFDEELETFFTDGSSDLKVNTDMICHEYPSPLTGIFNACIFNPEFIQIRKITFLWDWGNPESGLKNYDITFLVVKYFCTQAAAYYLNGIWVIPYKSKDKRKKIKVCYHFPLNSGNSVIYNTYADKSKEGYLLNPTSISLKSHRCVYRLFHSGLSSTIIKDRLAYSDPSFGAYISDIFNESFYFYA